VRADWDDLDNAMDREAEPVAKQKLRSRKRFMLEKFHWHGDDPFLNKVKIGHQIIQAIRAGSAHRLYTPSRVIHTKRYTKGGTRQLIVYLEAPRLKPAWRAEETVRAALGPLEQKLVLKHAVRRIRDPRIAHVLFHQWPGRNSE
jgi:hypothetical protein